MGLLEKHKTKNRTAPTTVSAPAIPNGAVKPSTVMATSTAVMNAVQRISLKNIHSVTRRGAQNIIVALVSDAIAAKQSFLYVEFPNPKELCWSLKLGLPLVNGETTTDWLMQIRMADAASSSAFSLSTPALLTENGTLVNHWAYDNIRRFLLEELGKVGADPSFVDARRAPYPFVVESTHPVNDVRLAWKRAAETTPTTRADFKTSFTEYRTTYFYDSQADFAGYRGYQDGRDDRPMAWTWLVMLRHVHSESSTTSHISPLKLRYGINDWNGRMAFETFFTTFRELL